MDEDTPRSVDEILFRLTHQVLARLVQVRERGDDTGLDAIMAMMDEIIAARKAIYAYFGKDDEE